eukprot:361760-Chlamydomonas_euryale.AAC.1
MVHACTPASPAPHTGANCCMRHTATCFPPHAWHTLRGCVFVADARHCVTQAAEASWDPACTPSLQRPNAADRNTPNMYLQCAVELDSRYSGSALALRAEARRLTGKLRGHPPAGAS